MQRRGAEYRGLLYCGLMLTADGPKVIEYNVRFGDPECQVIVPRLESDLYVHCYESAVGKLETPVVMREDACVALYLAAEGYPPEPTRTGDVIEGLDAAAALPGVLLFHAGTRAEGQAVVTNGGRVVMVSALGADGRRARATARTRPQPASPGPASTTVATSPPKRSMTRHRDPHMIPRYSLPEIADLFTDEARFAAWLEVEVLAVEAWAELGVVPGRARADRARAGRVRRPGRSTSARRSPTTTSPRSSTSCRRPSARPRAAGCTTGSRRATSSTPRSRCR